MYYGIPKVCRGNLMWQTEAFNILEVQESHMITESLWANRKTENIKSNTSMHAWNKEIRPFAKGVNVSDLETDMETQLHCEDW